MVAAGAALIDLYGAECVLVGRHRLLTLPALFLLLRDTRQPEGVDSRSTRHDTAPRDRFAAVRLMALTFSSSA